ncbi:uncharacterized protein BP01DRAFT_218431 [Aspergillus saccharolyticus JOP 1030-1]|uniref:Uncharacterized protein n=1 Tax=Aspergillus saccharolyticus JOP 1030-1 TaxID=1450539 RepID=A0A318ZL05_9EURO|nr:hypothetical protein BP01DRAFT_218431 [Aspergillus saccharolyticus JOP 1030-1]PYH47547.1 hypothetical protein BP01DRAFT_218431 [Aspergillus saccharolyticus JOP 1030-1]
MTIRESDAEQPDHVDAHCANFLDLADSHFFLCSLLLFHLTFVSPSPVFYSFSNLVRRSKRLSGGSMLASNRLIEQCNSGICTEIEDQSR